MSGSRGVEQGHETAEIRRDAVLDSFRRLVLADPERAGFLAVSFDRRPREQWPIFVASLNGPRPPPDPPRPHGRSTTPADCQADDAMEWTPSSEQVDSLDNTAHVGAIDPSGLPSSRLSHEASSSSSPSSSSSSSATFSTSSGHPISYDRSFGVERSRAYGGAKRQGAYNGDYEADEDVKRGGYGSGYGGNYGDEQDSAERRLRQRLH
ncbi:hypothetical protein RTBOTA2_001860 [Rhodotorula toruloides]|nr:hypothetical protein RTBOTA2_001860 [Rhodotorula toruloides]